MKKLSKLNEKIEKISISVNSGITINLGNYESFRYDLSLGTDCLIKDADTVKADIDNYIRNELLKIKNQIKNKEK